MSKTHIDKVKNKLEIHAGKSFAFSDI